MSHLDQLAHLERGCTKAEALAFYDSLEALHVDSLRGRWRGRGLSTGHPMDGLLESSGWYGKQFDDLDSVHPLLFEIDGEIYRSNPKPKCRSMSPSGPPDMALACAMSIIEAWLRPR